jgi:hypothetical protein
MTLAMGVARPGCALAVGPSCHLDLLRDLAVGVAHQAIFHRLIDLLLALDLGLRRVVALLRLGAGSSTSEASFWTPPAQVD